ncbi:hypothetical protein H9P43_005648 [Blastocladiella emersonii ATCC 22665]|nr:hypothetical protein H9P43_005648 [Blastocladiella emersonii ATCC 22665]
MDSQHNTSSNALAPFESYDFAGDATFQAGLKSILAGVADPADHPAATDKARRFYYARLTAAAAASAPAPAPAPASPEPTAAATEPAYPASFAEIVRLVSEGKPVPGVREIPDKLNDAAPTPATLAPRRKPWET